MKKAMIISAVLGLFVLLALWFFLASGPDLASYEPLREPRIVTMPGQTMLEATVTGDPAEAGKKAFGSLFKIYYKVIGSSKERGTAIPRARWPKPFSTPRNEWIGIYGLPVPADITVLPEQKGPVRVKLATWEYGEVAEILHVGPYSTEPQTIGKLLAFIKSRGYRISGPHEEEYLRGPGLLFAGDPAGYYTIIRYQVKKTTK